MQEVYSTAYRLFQYLMVIHLLKFNKKLPPPPFFLVLHIGLALFLVILIVFQAQKNQAQKKLGGINLFNLFFLMDKSLIQE